MKRDVEVTVYITVDDDYMKPVSDCPKKSKLQVALVKAVAMGEWEVTEDEPHNPTGLNMHGTSVRPGRDG